MSREKGDLGGLLAAVVFLVAFPLVGGPLGACAPRLAFRSVFGFAGSASGFGAPALGVECVP